MGFLHGVGRISTWIDILFIVFIGGISTATSQNGFLSIDCGSNVSYTDSNTGIFWETDANYTSTGRNIKNITVYSVDPADYPIVNTKQDATLRYFDDPRSRDCYVLPVQIGETYLIRATFFYGSLGNNSISVSFTVYIDSTPLPGSLSWDPVAGNSPYLEYTTEAIYSASKTTLDVCLVRDASSSPSFISALELRHLAPGMYSTAVGPNLGKYLFNNIRVNCGPSETGPTRFWRYPGDTYDRVWGLFGPNDNATHISNTHILASNSFAQDPDRPPLVVMQDAWVYYYSNILYLIYTSLSSSWGRVYTAAYFQELDGNASATNVRGMDFYLNGNFTGKSFNSSDQPLEIHQISDIQDLTVNVSFVQASWSHLRPILNAFELYSIYEYNSSTTFDEDVSALLALQVRLNLTDWTGDPCAPSPFDWLACTSDLSTPRITNLNLANHGYGGSIPPEISNLTALIYLALNNNSFDGPIPDFSNLVHLQAIYLQDNHLIGGIPSFLGSAFPNLTQLNLDNNNLNGTVPSDLSQPGPLNFTVFQNPLINCTVPACGAVAASPKAAPSGKSSSSGTIIGAVVGGLLGALVAVAVVSWIIWMLCTRKRRMRTSIIRAIGNAENQTPGSDQSVGRKALAGSMTLLTLEQVSEATKVFTKKIGEGNFGPVYYGRLPNGQEVAVKVKSSESRQGFQEFLNEVELLSRIHHRNLVSLVGYCEEGSQQILVYAYVPNGTLRDHLYADGFNEDLTLLSEESYRTLKKWQSRYYHAGDKSRKPLDWRTRLDIALNAARGLEYLHTDCNPRIIHRDVKTSNILIDENMVAKVADFGISKQAPEGIFSGVDTLLKGTPGYFDPEYFITQRLTQKSDVYSFGVVLLELVSGRHPHVSDLPDGSSGTLIQWVRSSVDNERVLDIVDPSLKGEFNVDSMMTVISLAMRCIELATAQRPDMKQVVRAITEAIELEPLSEIIIKGDQDINTPVAEAKESDYPFTFEHTEVLEVGHSSIVLPR